MTETLQHGTCPTCGIRHTRIPNCTLPPYPLPEGRTMDTEDYGSARSRATPPKLDPVVEAVRADLHRRSIVGIQKYGKTLAENPLSHRDWLQHAYEEVLDAANYLKRCIMAIDGYPGVMVTNDAEQQIVQMFRSRPAIELNDAEFAEAEKLVELDQKL